MKPVITPAESARLDSATEVPVAALMERAGLGVALEAVRMGATYGRRVLVLAGPGNNGGDGYVAARHLRSRGVEVEVHSLGYPRGDGSVNRAVAVAAAAAGVPVMPLAAPEECDLLIDALFGAGFRGSLPEVVLPWLEHPAPVLAVDLPSGLSGEDGSVAGGAFTAARTVTFNALKLGHLVGEGPDRCGRIEVIDIGLSGGRPEMWLCEDADAAVPNRPRTAHKWSAGSAAVVGASPGISGAAVIAARSALEFGAGAVRLIVPGAIHHTTAAMDPGVMVTGVGEGDHFGTADAPKVLEVAERFGVLAVGPGLGLETGGLVEALLAGWERPLVLDADGINSIDVAALKRRTAPTVITPHAGEFHRLAGTEASHRTATALAAETGAVVLLKGSPTFVMGVESWVVTSGGSELATIGTGDVLTGMIAALMARGLDPERAARTAAHRHGRAGRALAARAGTVTATALAAEIGRWAW